MSRRPYGYEGQQFAAYFWFVGWWAFSFGFHIDLRSPNAELHVPFGFFRVGRPSKPERVQNPARAALDKGAARP